MQEFFLSADQLQSILTIAHFKPIDGAPLSKVSGGQLAEISSGFTALLRHNVIIRDQDGFRINSAFLAQLIPLCRPDEMLELITSEKPTASIFARTSGFATEFSALESEMFRIAFPFDWNQMCATLQSPSAFQNRATDTSPNRFQFSGTAAEAVLLSLVTTEAARGQPASFSDLCAVTQKAVASPEFAHPFVRLGLAMEFSLLEPVEQVIPAILKRLLDRQFVTFQDGRFFPMQNVAETFSDAVVGEMTIARTLRTDLGLLTRRLSVVRQSRGLLVMSASAADQGMRIDWRAMMPESFTDYLLTALDWHFPTSTLKQPKPSDQSGSTQKNSAVCPGCGSTIIAGSKFCNHCGSQLAVTACPSCQHQVANNDRFCAACGCGLRPDAAATTNGLTNESPKSPATMNRFAGVGASTGTSTKIVSAMEPEPNADGAPRPNSSDFPSGLAIALAILAGLGCGMSLLILAVVSDAFNDINSFLLLHSLVAFSNGLIACLTSIGFVHGNRKLLRYAAMLACIPLLSPGILLGIPLGIWILLRLRRSAPLFQTPT